MDQPVNNPNNPDYNLNPNVKLTRNQRKKEKKKNKKKGIQKLEMPDLGEIVNNVPISSFSDDEDFKSIESRFYNRSIHEIDEDLNEENNETDNNEPTVEIQVSKQQVKKYGRPTIGMLKSISRRPELIEPFDNHAPDPFILAEIKNMRNIVPIPTHWSQKRKYLNYKKGSEVSRYRLPLYLEKTGIPRMRQAIIEFEEKRSLSQKQRERARPKTGLFDVSETILKDSFFRQQTKPYLSRFGDLYYEGREAMPNHKNIKPGKISNKLREALGLTENQPPPWLSKMQNYGPPPSYPNLKIPGLNAPLPKGAQWGNHLGGWGHVPLDENKNPLWGGNPLDPPVSDDEEEKTPLWGTLQRSEGIEYGVNI